MKILIPIGYLYPAENGGPALTLYWLGKALKTKKISTLFITSSLHTNNKVVTDTYIDTEYGKVIYLKIKNPNYSLKYIFFTIKQIKNYDIILLTSAFALSNLFFLLWSTFKGKKVILSPRGEFDEQALIYNKHFKKLVLFIINILSEKSIFFHVTSEQESIYLNKVIKQKFNFFIIPNFLEIPKLLYRTEINNYILYVGRFHQKKAIENLINALTFSEYFLRSNYTLKLVGDADNNYGKEMRILVNNLGLDKKVKFIGIQTGNSKEIIYANALCTIIPSHTENFCNVVIESLSQSTPVIASKGTPWSSLDDNNCGFWVDNTPVLIAEKIDTFLKMSEINYNEMRLSSRLFIENNFDITNGVFKWIDLFKKIYVK